MRTHSTQPHAAVDTALSRARRLAGTAAFAAALVPLGTLSAHAFAAASGPTETQAVVPSFGDGKHQVIAYTFSYANGSGQVYQIELPEVTAGDLDFNFNNGGSIANLPANWAAKEFKTKQLSTTALKTGVAGAYVDLIFQGGIGALGNGTGGVPTLTFDAAVPTTATVSSTFALQSIDGVFSIDPGVPATGAATTVPEPVSLGAFAAGLLAMASLRRRKPLA